MCELNDTEINIKNKLDTIPGISGLDRSGWTKTVKNVLGELGKELGYEVCAGGVDDFENEWLFDLVWYYRNKEDRLVSIPLVVECEWDIKWNEIKYDFEKLLLSNSEHRLMICEAKKNKWTPEELIEKCKASVNNYKQLNAGDRFLIAILHEDEGKYLFRFELIIK